MNRLRTYFARLIVAVLIWTGFCLNMVQPAHAEQSSQDFASWLTQMAKSSNGVDLQKELNDLQESGDHLDQLIKKASKIVSSNNDGFEFSLKESIASKHLYQFLLIEWSQFQTGNEMANVPVQPTVKLLVSIVEKMGSIGSGAVFIPNTEPFFEARELIMNPRPVFSVMLEPMAAGIAIGAP